MDSIAIILIVVGIILLVAEIFIPSFGITGLIGIISILVGVVFTAETFVGGLLMFIVILLFAVILMYIAFKIMSSVKSPFILKAAIEDENPGEKLEFFVGKKGTALTPLRPSGTADFEGVRLDVLTQGEFIEKNSSVTVSEIKGKRIIVKIAD